MVPTARSGASGDGLEPAEVLWPNQTEVRDGVVPYAEVPQDPDLFLDEEEDDE